MIIILLIGGITYEETEEEIKIKETEEINYDITEKQKHNEYNEKYLELYKHKHEPHNKHKNHTKITKKQSKKTNNMKKST